MLRAPPLRFLRSERRSVDPGGERSPGRIALGSELAAAGVKHVAAVLRRQRMQQQPAGRGVAGIDQLRDRLEIFSRLLLGPDACAGRQPLQVEGVVALDMTDIT